MLTEISVTIEAVESAGSSHFLPKNAAGKTGLSDFFIWLVFVADITRALIGQLIKEASLDLNLNDTVVPEKQLFRRGHPNSGFEIKYTKICIWVFRAKALTNRNQAF